MTRLLVPILLAVLIQASQPAAGADCERSFRDIYITASPAVVTVTTRSVNPYRVTKRVQRGVGSGFIVAPNGLIVTNSHVVYGAQALAVTLDDGTVRPARVVGQDPIFDIAVIQIPTESEREPSVGRVRRLRRGAGRGRRRDDWKSPRSRADSHARGNFGAQSPPPGKAAVAVPDHDPDGCADQSRGTRAARCSIAAER